MEFFETKGKETLKARIQDLQGAVNEINEQQAKKWKYVWKLGWPCLITVTLHFIIDVLIVKLFIQVAELFIKKLYFVKPIGNKNVWSYQLNPRTQCTYEIKRKNLQMLDK